jgi:hypothetical protein
MRIVQCDITTLQRLTLNMKKLEPGVVIWHQQCYSTKMHEELEYGQQWREQVTGGIYLKSRSAVNQSVHRYTYHACLTPPSALTVIQFSLVKRDIWELTFDILYFVSRKTMPPSDS